MTRRAPETLFTTRLMANSLCESSLADLRRLHEDREVMETLGGRRPEGWSRWYLDCEIAHWREHVFGAYGLRLRETGEWIGRAGLRYSEVEGNREVELDYALLPAYWSRGYATEIARELLDLAMHTLLFSSVVAFTLPGNAASRRVMQRSGLRYEGEVMHAGTPHVLYRMTNPFGSPSAYEMHHLELRPGS